MIGGGRDSSDATNLTTLADIAAAIEESRNRELLRVRDVLMEFRRFKHNAAGYPIARAKDCRPVTGALRDYFEKNRRLVAGSDSVVIPTLIEIIASLHDSSIAAYPGELLQLELLEAEVLLAAGRHDEALEIVGPMANRPYLVSENFAVIAKAIELDTVARLSLGRVDEVAAVAYGRLKYLAKRRLLRSLETRAVLGRALAVGRLFAPGWSVPRLLVQLVARLQIARELRIRTRLGRWFVLATSHAIGVLGTAIAAMEGLRPRALRIQVLPGAPARAAEPGGEEGILVTRAMGGIGDLLMMTPGLHALAQQQNQPIHFATRRQFFPVFANNPDVKLLDIESSIDLGKYLQWFDLSICPAARYESRARPNIRKGRVELFAKGMRIGKRQLSRSGLRPRYLLSAVQQEFAAGLRARARSASLPLIGVQPYSRDSYKHFKEIFAVIGQLAADNMVVVLHTSATAAPQHPNIISIHGHSLDESIAAVSACDYFISIDSVFYHAAAAFDVPSVGIFGPTDGKMFSLHHPRHILAEPPKAIPCVPCWRNEDIPCYLSGSAESACLNSITVDQVVAAVETLKKRYLSQHQSERA